MSSGNDSILDAFLYETNTLLEQLDSLVLAAEQQDSFSQDDINTIFRIMHTIKGSSAMMEYNSLMTIAHRAEDLFSIIRDKTMDVVPENLRPELFDLLFQAIDFFRGELEHIENEQPLTENIDILLGKINRLIDEIRTGGQPADAAAPAAPAAPSNSSAPAGFPYGLQIFFDEGCGMENLRAYMLLNTIHEFCSDSDMTYEPQGVESDPATADQIAESGFMLHFRTQADRDNAIQAVTRPSTKPPPLLSRSRQPQPHLPQLPLRRPLPLLSSPLPCLSPLLPRKKQRPRRRRRPPLPRIIRKASSASTSTSWMRWQP